MTHVTIEFDLTEFGNRLFELDPTTDVEAALAVQDAYPLFLTNTKVHIEKEEESN